ncbi:DeoR/GlpR family DNA-binding transcription regulator [Candidatus Rhodobacter oscarellae]|nr:DeoR/GlpR family DNA-binding transcription regulator [Candidatus Rhodobacter lobularis]
MPQSFRQPDILEIARRDGKVTVDGLAEHFGVTVQTIRRDLAELAEAGRLSRVHGGAVLPSGLSNIAYQDRRGLNAQAKAQIARRAAELIPDGASLFLNIGTTTEAVAQALLHHERLLVVTNNMNVANILMGNPGAEVVVAGGTMRHSDGGLIGPMALRMVEQFSLDCAVIGCSALSESGDILDFDLGEVSVSQAMLQQSARKILVADGSKFSRKAPARIARLDEMDHFATDADLPAVLAERVQTWKTEVLI